VCVIFSFNWLDILDKLKEAALRNKLPWFLALGGTDSTSAVVIVCRCLSHLWTTPSHGLIGLSWIYYNHAVSSKLFTGHVCLVHDGCCYSVLDYNMAAALYTCAAVHAVQQAAPIHVPLSRWLWRNSSLLLYSTETKTNKKTTPSLYHGACSSGSAMCSIGVQCRWGGAWWPSMDINWLYAVFFCLFGGRGILSPMTLYCTYCFSVHAYWECKTVYMHFSSVSIIWLILNNQKGLKLQKANKLLFVNGQNIYSLIFYCCLKRKKKEKKLFSAALSYLLLI